MEYIETDPDVPALNAMTVSFAEQKHSVPIEPIDLGPNLVAAQAGSARRQIDDLSQWKIVAVRPSRRDGRVVAGVVHVSEWDEVVGTEVSSNRYSLLLE